MLSSAPIGIWFSCPGADPAPWAEALRAALPQVELRVWEPGSAPWGDYAWVWSPPQAFLDEQPQLRGLFNLGAGVDALLKLRLPPTLPVVRVEDAGMGLQMAEYVCHALIHDFRGMAQMQEQQAQSLWQLPAAPDRSQYPVGILGWGVLGGTVGRAVASFGFPVRAWSRTAKSDAAETATPIRHYSGDAQFDDFLRASRALVCLLPLTPATENILCRDHLQRLQPGGCLVNVARGAHLVEEDLLELLSTGHLSSAALDVFRQEPLPSGHPFWSHPRIRITPHTSARTLRATSVEQMVGKLQQVLQGTPWEQIGGWVDPARGY